jgi:AcrR family transcriptional regulator
MIERVCTANLYCVGQSCQDIRKTEMSSENPATRRKYRKRRRAEQEAETRLAITEAAVKLHGTVGPARTTIKAIAAEAGVQRATVYSHFPDLESLFISCSTHWARLNPPPDPAEWSLEPDPAERLRQALTELYRYYVGAEPLLTNVYRDTPMVPASARAGENFQRHFDALQAALMRGRRTTGRARVRTAAAIGHALDFATWQSLTRKQRLENDDAVEMMIALVAAAGRVARRASRPSRPRRTAPSLPSTSHEKPA